MNADQKQRAKDALTNCQASDMAALLQEMIATHDPKPVARVTGYYAGYLSIATVDGRVLPAGTALYAAPPHQSEHHLEMVNTPAPSVPDGWKHDCAGILQNDVELWLDSCPHCGKPRPAEAPADLVRDAEPWKLLLENLVEGLNKTYWSSWQGTAHFDEYLREAIYAIERDKQKGGEA